MNVKRGTKIRKFIWEGEAVRVSALYQCATVFGVSICVICSLGNGEERLRDGDEDGGERG